MKKLILCLSVFSMLLCGTAMAQQRANRTTPQLPNNISPRQYAEILQYLQQMQSYNDPKQVVRRNAEFRAEQRRARIATRKWFGYSNARPIAAVTPYMSTYSPMWGGNGWHPFIWSGGGHHHSTAIIVSPDSVHR